MPNQPTPHGPLTRPTSELLARAIQQILTGTAIASETSAVLRRVCDESRDRAPEVLLLRIKQLWATVAEGSRVAFAERDRRYFSLIGECLELYYHLPPAHAGRHIAARDAASTRARGGCGEPEGVPLR